MLPFTTEEFLGVFERYNESVWPMSVVLYVVGWLAVVLSLWRSRLVDRFVSALLAGLWLWMAIAYHLWHFSRINPAAYVFGILFIVQAVLFFHAGTLRAKLNFLPHPDLLGVLGAAMIVFALLVYPLLNNLLGHDYPKSPTFGLPCPTTIFTFGLLLWARTPPRSFLVVPAIWTLIGGTAVFFLGMREDIGLLVSGFIAIPMLLSQRHN